MNNFEYIHVIFIDVIKKGATLHADACRLHLAVPINNALAFLLRLYQVTIPFASICTYLSSTSLSTPIVPFFACSLLVLAAVTFPHHHYLLLVLAVVTYIVIPLPPVPPPQPSLSRNLLRIIRIGCSNKNKQ